MVKKAPFGRELFSFLRALEKNNDKAWFGANRPRYEEAVREPLLAFIVDFSAPLEKLSPHFIADPRKQGGSMFRIHRDIRFSKDKRPYKTHAAIQFRHEAGKDVHAPGFYLHLEPGNVFLGAGLWRPDGPSLRAIRDAIVEDPAGWKKAVGGRAFKGTAELHGESLARAPRGFDAEHALIEDLKRKDFIALTQLEEKDALAPGFGQTCAKSYRAMAPLVAFLCKAIDLPF